MLVISQLQSRPWHRWKPPALFLYQKLFAFRDSGRVQPVSSFPFLSPVFQAVSFLHLLFLLLLKIVSSLSLKRVCIHTHTHVPTLPIHISQYTFLAHRVSGAQIILPHTHALSPPFSDPVFELAEEIYLNPSLIELIFISKVINHYLLKKYIYDPTS